MRRGAAWATTVALIGFVASCGSGSGSGSAPGVSAPAGKNAVILRDIAFKPDRIVVKAGETVTWRFEDQGISHDVAALDKSFKSKVQDSGTFTHTFAVAGSYDYQCTLHPTQMKGTIVVR